MIRQTLESFLHVLKAPALLSRYGLWSYAIAPIIVTVVVAASLIPFAMGLGDNLGNWMFSWYSFDFGQEYIDKIDDWIGRAVLGVGALFIFKYLVLIISSPFMSLLSERMEEKMYGQSETELTFASFFGDLMRGIRINVRNLMRELFYTLVLMLLSLIPVVNFVTTPLIFVVQAYYAGFGNMDFTMERHYDVKNSVLFVRQNRGLAIGNGIAFLLLFMIPVVGTILCLTFTATSAAHLTLKTIYDQEDLEGEFQA